MAVESVGQSGDLPSLWKKDVMVDLQSFSKNYIDVVVDGAL